MHRGAGTAREGKPHPVCQKLKLGNWAARYVMHIDGSWADTRLRGGDGWNRTTNMRLFKQPRTQSSILLYLSARRPALASTPIRRGA
jgi:hypothetical protein